MSFNDFPVFDTDGLTGSIDDTYCDGFDWNTSPRQPYVGVDAQRELNNYPNFFNTSEPTPIPPYLDYGVIPGGGKLSRASC